ncbi:MAG: DUF4238 domain-containing protein [Dehalococcoidia bacterium]|nr:MAG: DUF4238 domain-containing protein [Dehalococcoidia bacterium]
MTEFKSWNEPNLSFTEVRRQHYVPQLLLREFVVDNKIRVFDLDENTEFRTSTVNAAVANQFYDEHIADYHLSTETWLANLENEAAPIIKKLLDNPDTLSSLSTENEVSFSRFLAALRFRTPAFRERMEKTFADMLTEIKKMGKRQIYAQFDKAEADYHWADIENKPDSWWFQETEPHQQTNITNHMLGEIQGYANLLRAAPWRIGRVPDSCRLYSSDNPISGYLQPVRLVGEGGAFSSFTYYVPLSPKLLLEIMRRPDNNDKESLQPRGGRKCKNFSEWEIAFARNVITNDARRYLFGDGTIVLKNEANDFLERIGKVQIEFSIRYFGYNPSSFHQMGNNIMRL